MATNDWKKVIKQLKNKPAKEKKFLKHNKSKERKTGITRKQCEKCGRTGAHISSYGLNLCRQCFRQIAVEIGFKKYS